MDNLWEASAPGKVILFGEHAVVYGKKGIASSINLRTHAKLSTKSDRNSLLFIRSAPFETLEFPLPLLNSLSTCFISQPEASHTDQFKEITTSIFLEENQKRFKDKIREYVLENNIKWENIDNDNGLYSILSLFSTLLAKNQRFWQLEISSELPFGAGLGSSAAYHASISGVILNAYASINNFALENWKFWTNELAFALEKIVHGPSASGIDNMISVYGGMLSYQNKLPSFYEKVPELQVLITNTNVKRNTKQLVQGVRTNYDMFPKVFGHILDSIEEISNEFEKEISGPTPNEIKIGKLISLNHQLCVALGVSHPSLEFVKYQLESKYALATKLTGAGGGGCAISFIPSTGFSYQPDEIKQCLSSESFNLECILTTIGGSGLQ